MGLWKRIQYFNRTGHWSPVSRAMKRRIRNIDGQLIESLVVFCSRCKRLQGKEHRPCFAAERCDCSCYLGHILRVRNDGV